MFSLSVECLLNLDAHTLRGCCLALWLSSSLLHMLLSPGQQQRRQYCCLYMPRRITVSHSSMDLIWLFVDLSSKHCYLSPQLRVNTLPANHQFVEYPSKAHQLTRFGPDTGETAMPSFLQETSDQSTPPTPHPSSTPPVQGGDFQLQKLRSGMRGPYSSSLS